MATGQPIFQENDATDQHAIQLRQAWKSLYGGRAGVTELAGCKVSQRGAGANMSVDVAIGGMQIAGSAVTNQGFYYDFNDAVANVAISASHPSNPRNTLVIVQVRDAFYSGSNNDAILVAVDGTPSGSPADPDLVALGYTNYLVLARVLVGAAVTSIVDGNITNLAIEAVARGGIRNVPGTSSITSPTTGEHLWDTTLNRRWKRTTGGAWVMDKPSAFAGAANSDGNEAVALNDTQVYQQMKSLSVSPSRDCLAYIQCRGTFNCVLNSGNFRAQSRIQVDNADHPVGSISNTFNYYWVVYDPSAGSTSEATAMIFWPLTSGSHTIDWDMYLTTGSAGDGEIHSPRIHCIFLDVE